MRKSREVASKYAAQAGILEQTQASKQTSKEIQTMRHMWYAV